MIETLVDRLEQQAASKPHDVLYQYLDNDLNCADSLTYHQLVTDCRRVAVALQKFPPGSRILIMFQPGLDFIISFFACLYAGMIAVPAYPPRLNQTLERLNQMASNANASAILTSENLA